MSLLFSLQLNRWPRTSIVAINLTLKQKQKERKTAELFIQKKKIADYWFLGKTKEGTKHGI